ncbi:MAG: FkbM family methyltransferase [Pararhodobacter sp.]|nr:FkbM family methyltransferase [Pararhodobacter sp.]
MLQDLVKALHSVLTGRIAGKSPNLICKIIQASFVPLSGGAVKIRFMSSKKLFEVREGSNVIFVARASRLITQRRGIEHRQEALRNLYLGGIVSISEGDLVIDCGANIGEFSLRCNTEGAEVVAFEPDPREFRALSENAKDRFHVHNLALWHEDGELTFFEKNDTADSSLIDPGDYTQKTTVKVARLDSVRGVLDGSRRIKLMKLEAEGAEPEILEGAGALLHRIDFIAVDMGPERGVAADTTVVPVVRHLAQAGFELVYFNHIRCIGLFRNTILEPADDPSAGAKH